MADEYLISKLPLRLIEAAEACAIHIDGLSTLARSERVRRGATNDAIASNLGKRFDEMAADLIADGAFTLVCNPVELDLRCFPVLQQALSYLTQYFPSASRTLPVPWRVQRMGGLLLRLYP